MRRLWATGMVALTLLLAGCGGKADAPGAPPPGVPAGETPAGGTPLVREERDDAGGGGEASSSKAPDPQRWTPLEKLKPVSSGSGIVVCEPVAQGADEATAAFGAGCGRWLQLVVGGQPELGKTPLWAAMDRARRELERQDLRLTLEDAAKLAALTGATHVAVGEVRGPASACTLSYQLYELPARKPVGEPVALTGTHEQVLAGLPGLARTLATRLGAAKPRVPAAVEVNAAEVAALGRMAWFPDYDYAAAETETLRRLAPASPLAGLFFIRSSGAVSAAAFREAVRRLLEQAPENPLVFSEIGWVNANGLAPHRAVVERMIRRYPDNYPLAMVDVWLQRVLGNPDAERRAAERVVRLAPQNPDAWLTIGWTNSAAADRIRNGRVAGGMSAKEWATIEPLYEEWLAAVKRAVEIDPRHARAWLRLATAATFAGERRQASQAIQKALELDPDNPEVYSWGLQMYHSKWGGNPLDLVDVARRATEHRFPYARQSVGIAGALKQAGFEERANRLLDRVIEERQAAVKRAPGDAQAHYDLALALKHRDRLTEAIPEYQTVARLLPNDPEAHYELGLALEKAGRVPGALREYRETVRLAPQHRRAHYDLGWALKSMQQLDEAERELRAALKIEPRFPEAHYGLGEVYRARGRLDQAVAEYRQALALHPYMPEVSRLLVSVYHQQKKWDLAIAAAKQLLTFQPDDVNTHLDLSYSYGMSRRFEEAARHCRVALRLEPNNALAHENLGDSLIELGKKAEARAEWEKVLQLQREGPVADEARANLAKHR